MYMKEKDGESKKLKQQCLTKEVEVKNLTNESARGKEVRIWKEIEEAKALLAKVEKKKGKKGYRRRGEIFMHIVSSLIDNEGLWL